MRIAGSLRSAGKSPSYSGCGAGTKRTVMIATLKLRIRPMPLRVDADGRSTIAKRSWIWQRNLALLSFRQTLTSSTFEVKAETQSFTLAMDTYPYPLKRLFLGQGVLKDKPIKLVLHFAARSCWSNFASCDAMSPSVRAQRKRNAKREADAKETGEARAAAMELLRKGSTSIRKVSGLTGVPKTTVGNLDICLRDNKEDKFKKLLNTGSYYTEAYTMLSSVEEKMLSDRILYAANRGFAMDDNELKNIMTLIAADGQKTWENGIPNDEAIRGFRARHREISYRVHKRKILRSCARKTWITCACTRKC